MSPAKCVPVSPGQQGGGRQGVPGGCSASPLPSPPPGVNRVLEGTSSGGFCANGATEHITLTPLPFGGGGTFVPGNREGLQDAPARFTRGNPAWKPPSSAITPRRSLLPVAEPRCWSRPPTRYLPGCV